jgi:hypothetical protein
MASTDRSMSPGPIVGLVGGILLVAGSFLTWVTISLNVETFAKVISDATGVQVSPSDIDSFNLSGSQSTSGIKSDGKFTLVAGVVVVACAILWFAVANVRTVARVVMAIAGAVGALVAIFNILTKDSQVDRSLAQVEPMLRGTGISADAFRSVFNVEWGIGIFVCAIGGIIAVVGGIMATRTSGAAPSPIPPAPMTGTFSRAPETPQRTTPPAPTEPGANPDRPA